ncbi:MAG: hypothetical protein K2X29_10265 [Candidatus Obscuribacterales bacterium]|nr:hypothetical protein [Candidatus Obscuribacterales bacterium]
MLNVDLEETLRALDNSILKLIPFQTRDKCHLRVKPSTMNAVSESLIRDGHVDQRLANLKAEAVPKLSKQWYLEYLADQGEAVRMLDLAVQVNLQSLTILLECLVSNVRNGQLLTGMMAARAALEFFAQFESLVSELQKCPEPIDPATAKQMREKVHALLVKVLYGRRVDWPKLINEPRSSIRQNKLKYEPSELCIDLTASQILNKIDRLEKKVCGARGAYEVLCEFTHPNVGTFLLATGPDLDHQDENGLKWTKYSISGAVENDFPKELTTVFDEIFQVILECIDYTTESLMTTSVPAALANLKSMAQILVSDLLFQEIMIDTGSCRMTDVWHPYSHCPCGSGEKTKFCCGKR